MPAFEFHTLREINVRKVDRESAFVEPSALFGAESPSVKSDAKPCRHPGLLP
jgi:hypothetical protein